jgi:hypothetical protein
MTMSERQAIGEAMSNRQQRPVFVETRSWDVHSKLGLTASGEVWYFDSLNCYRVDAILWK